MCADAHLLRPHSNLVAELPWSYARLSVNQMHAGYCVVVFKRHACELPELPAAESSGF